MEREELAEMPIFRESSRFDDLEKAVLEFVEAMTATPAVVSDDLFDRLSAELTPEQITELTAAVALENFSARFNRAFAIEAEPGDSQTNA